MPLLPFIVILCSLYSFGQPQSPSETHNSPTDIILDTIFDNETYFKDTRPLNEDSPKDSLKVTVNIQIIAITQVDVRKMEYTMDLYLRQEWTDPRLAWKKIESLKYLNYDKKIVSSKIRQKAWLPDLFFRNGKEGNVHTMTSLNSMTRVNSDGGLLWSQKITMRFACMMHLQSFPMDSQLCYINIGSYGYEVSHLKFDWRSKSPVQTRENVSIAEFATPKRFNTFDCTGKALTSTGAYSCLNVTFVLSRELGSWLTSTYLPSILIVSVSWLSFWISLDAVPARVTLGLLALIGTLTQASLVTNTLPRVSYIKAIDVWTIVCIAFDISVLIEFALASNLAKRQRDQGWQVEVREAVREELAHWCNACQQQYHIRGPSATGAYHMHGGTDYMTCANNAAIALKRGELELCEQMEQLLANYESTRPRKALLKHPWPSGAVNLGFERLVNEHSNLLTPDTPEKPGKGIANVAPKKTSEIDENSRFLFPACFILYNSFYWIYYLVLQPSKDTQ
ncbi:hypothetical protein Ciccas_001728 [Cichlidogyrus casuarinus]|uniref:Uncharacterized protein n=1 Tax=Cichlidogyrus casuarinus TaxID=1844966 RepID=A0ABD2QMD2_9PLAT